MDTQDLEYCPSCDAVTEVCENICTRCDIPLHDIQDSFLPEIDCYINSQSLFY